MITSLCRVKSLRSLDWDFLKLTNLSNKLLFPC
jgi:hypothetical protein